MHKNASVIQPLCDKEGMKTSSSDALNSSYSLWE